MALFGLAFAGIFGASKFGWGLKASPVATVSVAPPPKPEARVPTFEESVQKGARKEWESSKTSQGDGEAGRNQLRLTALQAANAYALSPCDKAIKAAFEAGGVSKDDFPSGTQLWVATIAASHGDTSSPWAAGRQTQSRRP